MASYFSLESVTRRGVKMRFRDRLQRMMYGRYGNDELNRLFLLISVILLVVSSFMKIHFCYWAAIAFLALTYVRMFSKNVPKRYAENQKYLGFRNKYVGWFKLRALHIKQRKTYHFFSCPTCGQKVRVPRGKGMIEITCPKCRQAFKKRS